VLQHLLSKHSISPFSPLPTNQQQQAVLVVTAPPKEEKPAVLTTDAEAEIEITRSGIKKTSSLGKVESQKSSEEQKFTTDEPKKVANLPLPTTATAAAPPVRDEIAMEKAEADLLKSQKRSHQDPLQKLKDPPRPQVRSERNDERTNEKAQGAQSPRDVSPDLDSPKSQVGRQRESIVDGRPAGIGGGGDPSSKENSICSGNLDPYKGSLPLSPPRSRPLLSPAPSCT
jgi:hypothetical protein